MASCSDESGGGGGGGGGGGPNMIPVLPGGFRSSSTPYDTDRVPDRPRGSSQGRSKGQNESGEEQRRKAGHHVRCEKLRCGSRL